MTRKLDRHADSLSAAAEAIAVERRLGRGGRPYGWAGFPVALINYTIALVALDRLQERVAAGREACDAFGQRIKRTTVMPEICQCPFACL